MDDDLKDKALSAARAATMSAALVGATACSDGETAANTSTNTGEEWNLDDTPGDATSRDVSDDRDVLADAPSPPDATADAEGDQDTATCSGVSDDLCPSFCTRQNDADCCEQNRRCRWSQERGCGCAVPGPFVPPSIVA
jgi:hypothetical protein